MEMPEPKPPPRRRIAPIPIQPAVEPEPGLISNGAEICQHMPDVSLPPMPGRRMVVDLLSCNIVNYKKVLKNHMRSHSAGTATQQQGSSLPPSPQAAQQAHGKNADLIKRIQEKYVVHMDDTNSASQSGQGASGSDGAESSGAESMSSEDSKADVVSTGKPGDPQGTSQGSGSSGSDDSSTSTSQSGGSNDDSAGSGGQEDGEAAPLPAGKKPPVRVRAARTEAYEADFIDDTEDIRVQRPTQKPIYSGFYTHQGIMTLPSEPEEREGPRRPAVPRARRKVVDTAEHAVVVAPSSTQPRQAPGAQPTQQAAAHPSKVAKKRATEGSSEVEVKEVKKKKKVLSPPLTLGPVAAPAPLPKPATTLAQVAALAGRQASRPAPTATARAQEPVPPPPSLSPEPPPAPKPDAVAHASPSQAMVIRSCSQQPTSARKGTRAFKPVKSLVDCLVAKLGAPADANATGTVSGSGSPAPTRPTHLKSAHLKPQLVSLAQGLIREYGSLEVESAASAIAAVASAGRERWPEGVPMLTAQLQQHLDDALQQIQSLEEGLKTSLASWAASGDVGEADLPAPVVEKLKEVVLLRRKVNNDDEEALLQQFASWDPHRVLTAELLRRALDKVKPSVKSAMTSRAQPAAPTKQEGDGLAAAPPSAVEDLPASQYCPQQPEASLAPGVGLANAASVSRAAERLEAELLGSEAEEGAGMTASQVATASRRPKASDLNPGVVVAKVEGLARGGISRLTQELNMAELQCYLGTIGQSKQGRKLDLINRVAQHLGLASAVPFPPEAPAVQT